MIIVAKNVQNIRNLSKKCIFCGGAKQETTEWANLIIWNPSYALKSLHIVTGAISEATK